MNKNNRQKYAYIYGILAVILWSTVASAFKLTLEYFSPIKLLFYAVIFSLVVLFVIIIKEKKFHLLFAYSRSDYLKLALLGFINPFFYYLMLFKAYDLLPAQVAQPINYTWALTLSYMSFFILKHKLNIFDFLAGVICYIGILVISTKGDILSFDFTSKEGVVLAFSSTILWALYWIYNTKLDIDLIVGLFVSFVSGSVFISIYMLLFNYSFEPNIYGVLGSAYIGSFEMGITYVFWLKAMKLTSSSSKIANLIFISPFLSLIFIYFLVGEKILSSTFVGLVLIVFGLLLQQKKDKKLL
ncbi:MAG: DMT family transporter [Sulfurospirillum sp.]